MFVLPCTRHRLLITVTEGLHIDKACEIGVHRGDFSDFMLRQIPLNNLYLVDKWSSQEIVNNFSPFDDMPFYITDRLDSDLMNSFFDGSPYEQETIEKHYKYTAERFANDPRVKIIRESSFDALSHFDSGELDLIYIDANHQYEFILRDLMTWSSKLSPDGLMILNDCIISPKGVKQNLGVLQAAMTFIRNSDFIPIAIHLRDFADLVLINKNSKYLDLVSSNLQRYDNCIELPDCLIGQFSLKDNGPASYFSFN